MPPSILCAWHTVGLQVKNPESCPSWFPPQTCQVTLGSVPPDSGLPFLHLDPSSKAFGLCDAESRRLLHRLSVPQLRSSLLPGLPGPSLFCPRRGKEQKTMCFVHLTCQDTVPRQWAHKESGFTSLPWLLQNKDGTDFKPSAFGRKQYLPEIE